MVLAQLDAEGFARPTVLWTGMKDLTIDTSRFQCFGGIELAPTSTTHSPRGREELCTEPGAVGLQIRSGWDSQWRSDPISVPLTETVRILASSVDLLVVPETPRGRWSVDRGC